MQARLQVLTLRRLLCLQFVLVEEVRGREELVFLLGRSAKHLWQEARVVLTEALQEQLTSLLE